MLRIDFMNGWAITNGIQTFSCGSFLSRDKDAFKLLIEKEFKEVCADPAILPLLILCNTVDPNSAAYLFAVGYLEKLLDSQPGMDANRVGYIHAFVAAAIQGSSELEYDVYQRFDEVRNTLGEAKNGNKRTT